MKKRGKSNKDGYNYVHGFDSKEQERLYHQARFLEPWVFNGVDLEFRENLLEVGCGVGAQTKILTRRFPDLRITGVDLSVAQLERAQRFLADEIEQGRVRLFEQDAQKLDVQGKGKFDSAFVCWFLEHVPKPLQVLKRVRSHLRKGAKIYCTEVFNQTLFIQPYSPAYLKYWFEFNDYQASINGHPFIGGELGNLLLAAGFTDIQTEIRSFHFDARDPDKRAAFHTYFFDILLSAEKTLLETGRVTPAIVKEMRAEVERARKDPDSVFFYAFVRATARVP